MIHKIVKYSKDILHDSSREFSSHHREVQFYSSRSALLKCLSELGHKNLNYNDIEISDHLHLNFDPNLLVSLSHTKEYGAAIVAQQSDNQRSIGIDIELNSRHLKPKLKKMFVHSFDSADSCENLLELWSQKEAAFKAIDPLAKEFTDKEVLVLKDIWVRDNQFGLLDNQSPLGHLKTFTEAHEQQTFLVAIAVIS